MTSNKYSQVYQFKNSITVLFNDSITRNGFINIKKETPILPHAKDIIALNKKLETEFYNYIKNKYTGLQYDSLPDSEYYKEQENITLEWAKDMQNQMNYINKQLVSYRDSLGRKVFAVRIFHPQELQTNIEKQWIGNMISFKYDFENLTFLMD